MLVTITTRSPSSSSPQLRLAELDLVAAAHRGEIADLRTVRVEARGNQELDEVLETGQPLEIERNGKTLVIAPKEEQSIWDRLPRREGFIVGDPDELIHIDWSSEWNPDPS